MVLAKLVDVSFSGLHTVFQLPGADSFLLQSASEIYCVLAFKVHKLWMKRPHRMLIRILMLMASASGIAYQAKWAYSIFDAVCDLTDQSLDPIVEMLFRLHLVLVCLPVVLV